MAADITYIEVVYWDAFISAEHRKKLKPPYPWLKLPTSNLDTLGDLSNSEYGAYMRLVHLAAQTENRIPFRLGWIRRRTNVSQNLLNKLQNRGLILIRNDSVEGEKTVKDQSSLQKNSGAHSEQYRKASVLEGEGERDRDRDRNREEERASGPGCSRPDCSAPDNGLHRDDFDSLNPSPAPSQNWRTGQCKPVRHVKANFPRQDRRPFDGIKREVLTVATKLDTVDAEKIHRLAGQSLRASRKQIAVAVTQLKEDGEL